MAPMTNAVDVRTAAAEFDRTSVADVESAAEDERKQVLAQFPLEGWAELPPRPSAPISYSAFQHFQATTRRIARCRPWTPSTSATTATA